MKNIGNRYHRHLAKVSGQAQFLHRLSIRSFRDVANNEKKINWERWEFDKRVHIESLVQSVDEESTFRDDLWKGLSDAQLDRSLALLSDLCAPDRLKKMHSILSNRSKRIRFAFEDVSNLNNIWASLRTIDSFGLQYSDIILTSTADSARRQQTMTPALGTQKWLTLNTYRSAEDCISNARQLGYKVLATSLHEGSQSIFDVDWLSEPSMIIFGNEERGISETVSKLSDSTFHIPMKGFAQSLNLGASCAATCAVLQAKTAIIPNLSPNERRITLLTW